MARSIITDPLTGKQFSRDTEATGSTYAPHTPVAEQPVAAPAPAAPVVSPIQPKRTIDPGVAAAEGYLNKFTAPQSAAQIAEEKRQQSSGLIDSINKTYDDQVMEKRKVGQERLAMDNAISVLTGNTGGTEAVRTRGNVLDANDKEVQAVNNQRQLALSTVYTQISKDADVEARQQLTDATKSAEDILARRQASQTKAVENLKLMASSGMIDYDKFASSPENSKVYQYALDSVGGSEDALKGLFALNRPKETVLDKKWVGSKLYQVYQNPVTGATRSEVVDLGFEVPPNYTTEVDLGDRIMLLDPSNPDKKLIFSKGLTPAQKQDAGGGALPGGSTALSAQPGYAQLTAKQKSQADSLNNLVRTLQDYKDTYNANPGAFGGAAGNMFGADSGLLQTKVNSIIFAAAQAEGTGALQQADREVIEQIIPNPTSLTGAFNTLLKGGKTGNVAKIDDQIQKYTENLGSYGLKPLGDPSPNAQSQVLLSPDGQQLDASALTPEEYQEAVRDGYKPQ